MGSISCCTTCTIRSSKLVKLNCGSVKNTWKLFKTSVYLHYQPGTFLKRKNSIQSLVDLMQQLFSDLGSQGLWVIIFFQWFGLLYYCICVSLVLTVWSVLWSSTVLTCTRSSNIYLLIDLWRLQVKVTCQVHFSQDVIYLTFEKHLYKGFVILHFVFSSVIVPQDPVYISKEAPVKQSSCNGDWSYEVKHINGCPVAVTYPVARHCNCSKCNPDDTDCGPSSETCPAVCPPFPLSLFTLDWNKSSVP